MKSLKTRDLRPALPRTRVKWLPRSRNRQLSFSSLYLFAWNLSDASHFFQHFQKLFWTNHHFVEEIANVVCSEEDLGEQEELSEWKRAANRARAPSAPVVFLALASVLPISARNNWCVGRLQDSRVPSDFTVSLSLTTNSAHPLIHLT